MSKKKAKKRTHPKPLEKYREKYEQYFLDPSLLLSEAKLEEHAAIEQRWNQYVQSDGFRQMQERGRARREQHQQRIGRRPEEMRASDYRLPPDVVAFLRRIYNNPLKFAEHLKDLPLVGTVEAKELIDNAYMEGCRQGFIEGFLYGEDKARPGALKNRERLRQQNLDKLSRLGIADRNAEIVAEFHRLERELPGKEQRKEKLAADHDLTPKQIGNILRADKRRR
jgi:hypothetical protein